MGEKEKRVILEADSVTQSAGRASLQPWDLLPTPLSLKNSQEMLGSTIF